METENFQFKHRGNGMITVYGLDGKEVAKVQSSKGQVTNITLKQRGLDKGLLFQEASAYVTEIVGDVPITGNQGGQSMPTAKKKTAKKTAKKTVTKEKVAKKAPAKKASAKKTPSKKLGPAIDAVDLTSARDVPKTLALLTKKTGGLGYCGCGCGSPVKKRFLPGHDSKLKKVLKTFSTDNAKAVAAELGWEKIIKWTK